MSVELLRHTLATLAYRGGKAVRDAPPEFGAFRLGEKTRRPVEILAHVNDLLDWAWHLAGGEHNWNDSIPAGWESESSRFFAALEKLDGRLASGEPLGNSPEKLFQGPIADAFTHIGQLAMLRRIAGSPVRGENYYRADIERGAVGREQPAPRREFD